MEQQLFGRGGRLSTCHAISSILRGGKTVIPDPEGDALHSDADAIRHASMVAREMIEGRHFYRGQHLERWAFEITDDAGRRVATVPFADLPKSQSGKAP